VAAAGSPAADGSGIEDGGTTAALRAAGSSLSSSDGAVTLGTVTIAGNATAEPTTTIVDVGVAGIQNETGATYDFVVESTSSVTVTPEPGSGDHAVTVRLAPTGATVPLGGTRAFEVVATNASDGAGPYDLDVTTSAPDVVRFSSASAAGLPDVSRVEIVDGGGTASFQVAGNALPPSNGSVTLGRVVLSGHATGEAVVDVAVHSLGDADSVPYDDAGGDATAITVVDADPAVPPVVGDAPPTDPDGDGRYEDVDGDGDFDVFDVQAFLGVFDGDAVQSTPAAFDFDASGDGAVTIFDVQALLEEL
jgi:hypothetical protein